VAKGKARGLLVGGDWGVMKVRLGERCLSPSQNGGIYLQIFKRKFMFRSVYSVHFDKSLVLADDSVYSGERGLHKSSISFAQIPWLALAASVGGGSKHSDIPLAFWPAYISAFLTEGHYSCITIHQSPVE